MSDSGDENDRVVANNNVVTLRPGVALVRPEDELAQDRDKVIRVLEDALREARAGDIVNVALAVVRPDLALNTSWSPSSSIAPMLAAVSLLKHRILTKLDG